MALIAKRSTILSLVVAATVAVATATLPTTASAYSLYSRVDLKSASGLTSGPDGAIWMLANQGRERASVWRMSGDIPKRVRLKGVPSGSSFTSIAAGPDGRIWAIATARSKLKRKFVYRSVLYRIKSPTVYSRSPMRKGRVFYSMASGPDGRMWALGDWKNSIARISRSGKVEMLPITGADKLLWMAAGRAGDMWFVGDRKVMRRDVVSGAVMETSTDVQPATSIAIDLDGNAWVPGVGSIQKISRAGEVSRAAFVAPEFSSDQALSVFMRGDGRVGFLAGYSALGRVEYFVQTPSIGSVGGSGIEQQALTTFAGNTTWFPAYNDGDELSGPYRATTDSNGRIWTSTYAARPNTGLIAIDTEATSLAVPQNATILGSSTSEASVAATLECSGIPGRMCVGRVQVRSAGGAITSSLPYSLGTGQQSTYEIANKNRGSDANPTVELIQQ